jgi:hypothetical protein
MGEYVPCGLCGKMADCDCRTRPRYDTTKIDCQACGTFLVWLTWLMDGVTGRRQRCIDIPAYYSRAPGDALRYYVSAGNKKQLAKGLRTARGRPGRRLVGPDADIPRAIHPARDGAVAVVCPQCGNEQILKWPERVATTK